MGVNLYSNNRIFIGVADLGVWVPTVHYHDIKSQLSQLVQRTLS